MTSFLLQGLAVFFFLASFISAQDGYTGYKLDIRDDNDSVLFETANTGSNVTLAKEPDVFLNASVHVGEIDILVANLSAKINLDAQVLDLLKFNAGVDISIAKVSLTIKEVNARVLLEARLENLVRMVNSTLNSIDLNPIIAQLGESLGEIVDDTTGLIKGVTGQSSDQLQKRADFEFENNILYAVNDYSGNTHTNRVLAQNGDLVDQSLNNNGQILGQTVVGSYIKDMRFNGFDQEVTRNGKTLREKEYIYQPFPGLMAISAVFFDADVVVETRLIAEARGGGSSTIGGDL